MFFVPYFLLLSLVTCEDTSPTAKTAMFNTEVSAVDEAPRIGQPKFQELPDHGFWGHNTEYPEIIHPETPEDSIVVTKSTVVLEGSNFVNLRAHGQSIALGAGGGLVVDHGTLFSDAHGGKSSSFVNCQAVYGGGAALYESDAIIKSVNFLNCMALRLAGGLLVQGTPSFSTKGAKPTYGEGQGEAILDSCTFSKCISHEYSGALHIGSTSNTRIHNGVFFGNIARTSGGAISFYGCMGTEIFKSIFYYNEVDPTDVGVWTNGEQGTKNERKQLISRKVNKLRGGGAIAFTSTFQAKIASLYTRQCCWIGNINYATDFLGIHQSLTPYGISHCILFGGPTAWHSYFDYIHKDIKEDTPTVDIASKLNDVIGHVKRFYYEPFNVQFGLFSPEQILDVTIISAHDQKVYSDVYKGYPNPPTYPNDIYRGAVCMNPFSDEKNPGSITDLSDYLPKWYDTDKTTFTYVTKTPPIIEQEPTTSSITVELKVITDQTSVPEPTKFNTKVQAKTRTSYPTQEIEYATADMSTNTVVSRFALNTPYATYTPRATRTPTRSSYDETYVASTKTRDGETDAPPPEPFPYIPNATPTRSFGETPLQTTTPSLSATATRSVPGHVPSPTITTMRTTITASVSSIWEVPPPTKTATASFPWEAPPTPTPSRTDTGATWPLQTQSKATPAPTDENRTPVSLPIPSQSHWYAIPDMTVTPSISFQFELKPTRSTYDFSTPATFTTPEIDPLPITTLSTDTEYTIECVDSSTSIQTIVLSSTDVSVSAFNYYADDQGDYTIVLTDSPTMIPVVSFTETSISVCHMIIITPTPEEPTPTPEEPTPTPEEPTPTPEEPTSTPEEPTPTIATTTPTETTSEITTTIPSSGDTENQGGVDSGDDEDNKNNLLLIIGCIVGGLVLVSAIGFVLYKYVFKKSKEEEEESSLDVEMVVDQVVTINDSSQMTLTQENPLWTNDKEYQSEDPFKNDFEEDPYTVVDF